MGNQSTTTQTHTHTDGYLNGVHLETLQGTVNAIAGDPAMGQCKFRASNTWLGGAHNRTRITGFYGASQEIAHRQSYELHGDAPPIRAGNAVGATPGEHLLTALAACVTTSLVAHAAVRGIRIESLESELEGDIDLRGFLGLDASVPKGFTDIRVNFRVKTDPENIDTLKQLSTFSPVLNTLTHGANVNIQVSEQ